MDATLLEKAGRDSDAEGAHAYVEELDEHPVLAALVRDEAGVSVCGRTISPSRSTGLRMFAVFLPVLYTLSLSIFGNKVTASFDGCATRDGTPRSLDTCFACNGNTTVVHENVLDEDVTLLLVRVFLWPVVAVALEVVLLRGISARIRAAKLFAHGVYVRSAVRSACTVGSLVFTACAVAAFNAVSLVGNRRVGRNMKLGSDLGECVNWRDPGADFELVATFKPGNPTDPAAGARPLVTLTTLGASMFPFVSVFLFVLTLGREPLAFLRARAILKRPGAAAAMASHVRFSARPADIARSFNAHARDLPSQGAGADAGAKIARLFLPDALYNHYAPDTPEAAQALADALRAMRASGSLAPLRRGDL